MILPIALRMLTKSMAGLALLTGFSVCVFLPVNKNDVVGIYQSVLHDGTLGLPDGGSEILELQEEGTCKQEITFKDGRTLVAPGTWEWCPDKSYLNNTVIIKGIYRVLDEEDQIRSEFKQTKGILQIRSVGRTMGSRVIIGSRKGPHYEKK